MGAAPASTRGSAGRHWGALCILDLPDSLPALLALSPDDTAHHIDGHFMLASATELLRTPCRRDQLRLGAHLCNVGHAACLATYRRALAKAAKEARTGPLLEARMKLAASFDRYAQAARALNSAVGEVLFRDSTNGWRCRGPDATAPSEAREPPRHPEPGARPVGGPRRAAPPVGAPGSQWSRQVHGARCAGPRLPSRGVGYEGARCRGTDRGGFRNVEEPRLELDEPPRRGLIELQAWLSSEERRAIAPYYPAAPSHGALRFTVGGGRLSEALRPRVCEPATRSRTPRMRRSWRPALPACCCRRTGECSSLARM